MIWLIILLILIALTAYILFAPLRIEIDSRIELLRLRFGFLVSAQVIIIDNMPQVELKILGFRKKIPLTDQHQISADKPSKKKMKRHSYIPLKKIKAVLSSFRITKFYLTLSFSDMPTNGILYPLFWWIKFVTGKNIEINFVGQNQLVFYANNNLFRIMRAYASA